MLFEAAAYRVVNLGCESDKIEDKEAVDIILTAAIAHNQMKKPFPVKPATIYVTSEIPKL